MKIGFIGLGKMGSQMVQRLVASNHEVLAYDVNPDAVAAIAQKGAIATSNRTELIEQLDPVIVWLMIPSQFVDSELDTLLQMLPAGAIVIDGGNSDYRLTKKRAERCHEKSIVFIDVGTSGGIMGLSQGFSMMIGGDKTAVQSIEPLFVALAQPQGWHYFGPSGSGHYVKMVHNAIEYGMMESYAEGYRLLKEGPYAELDVAAAGMVWQHGSIIDSKLHDLTVDALKENPSLQDIEGIVAESGETRWALETAKACAIETPAIDAAMRVRIASQTGTTNFATKLLAAMRNKFGGHDINVKTKKDAA